MRERVLRAGGVALAAPIIGLLSQNDRTLGNRVAHLAFRGMTEDRVTVLCEEYFTDVLADKMLQRGVELIRHLKDEGFHTVLLSESISQIMTPLHEHLGHKIVDDLVSNHVEFKPNGDCTGRLLDPVIGGHDGGNFARAYCAEHGIDLAASTAYASHGPDLLLLAAVGRPCAVNPDFTLRRAAREAGWPIIDYKQDD